MRIKIQVHASSSQEKIEEKSNKNLEVWIKEKPVCGKANRRLEKFLKEKLKKRCKIVSGFNSNIKFVEVED